MNKWHIRTGIDLIYCKKIKASVSEVERIRRKEVALKRNVSRKVSS